MEFNRSDRQTDRLCSTLLLIQLKEFVCPVFGLVFVMLLLVLFVVFLFFFVLFFFSFCFCCFLLLLFVVVTLGCCVLCVVPEEPLCAPCQCPCSTAEAAAAATEGLILSTTSDSTTTGSSTTSTTTTSTTVSYSSTTWPSPRRTQQGQFFSPPNHKTHTLLFFGQFILLTARWHAIPLFKIFFSNEIHFASMRIRLQFLHVSLFYFSSFHWMRLLFYWKLSKGMIEN